MIDVSHDLMIYTEKTNQAMFAHTTILHSYLQLEHEHSTIITLSTLTWMLKVIIDALNEIFYQR